MNPPHPKKPAVTKHSKQRDRIYDIVRGTRSHPTAEWVHEEVRRSMPRVSLGTVYRNLHVLALQGRVMELDFGDGSRHYDAFTDEHYHFVCERCGSVQDINIPPFTDLNDRVSSSVSGIVRSHRLVFVGVCSSCQQHQ